MPCRTFCVRYSTSLITILEHVRTIKHPIQQGLLVICLATYATSYGKAISNVGITISNRTTLTLIKWSRLPPLSTPTGAVL